MQRCPKCYRTYPTETQKFCTACGGRLITDDGAETTPSLRETYATFVNTNPPASAPANFDPQQTVVTPPAPPSAHLDPLETVTMRPAPPPADKFDPLKTFNPSPASNVRPPNPNLEVTMLGPSSKLSFDAPRPTAESLGEGSKTNSTLPPASLKTTALNPASTRFEAATPPPMPPPVTPAPPVVTPPAVKPVPPPPAPSVPLVASVPLAPPVPVPAPPVPVPVPAPPVKAGVEVRPPVTPAPPVKRSKLPLFLGLAAVLLFGIIGSGVLAYLFVIKPRLAARQQPPPVVTTPEPPAPQPPVTDKTNAPPVLGGKKVPPVTIAPPNAAKFVNDRAQTTGKLAEHFVDFSFYYPKAWITAPTKGTNNFADVSRKAPDGLPQEVFTASWYESQGTFAADEASFAGLAAKKSADLEKSLPPSDYRKTDEGPTNVNGAEAYQFRFQGKFNGDVPYWGRVIFLPGGDAANKNGVTLFLLATAKATEVTSLEEVGVKGELPVILNTFRLGPAQ